MNKNLLAIAVGAAFAVPGAAFADVKVYGKFNVGIDSQKDEIQIDSKATDSTWRVQDQNNSSRLGVKGSEDTGLSDLKVIYQMEFGVNPDGSESNSVVTDVTAVDTNGDGVVDTNEVKVKTSSQERVFTQRNIFVGLQGGWGAVKVGKFDTPVKVAGEKADQFNDESIGDDTNLLVGETRANNMIQYNTPQFFNALTVTAAIAPGEGRTAVDDSGSKDKGLADTWYASVAYDSKIVYAAVAYAGNEAASMKFDGATAGYDVLRGAVYVKPIADLELGALLQQAKGIDQKGSSSNANGSDAKETSWLLSAGYSISAAKLKAQYGETKGDQTDIKRNMYGLGVDYKLSKSFVTQVYYVNYKDKDRVVSGVTDPKTTSYGLGLVYSF